MVATPPLQLSICAADCDDIWAAEAAASRGAGACTGGANGLAPGGADAAAAAAATGASPDAVVSVVRGLQDLGFKVILVTQGHMESCILERLASDRDGIEGDRLLLHLREHEGPYQVLRVASEYGCLFLSNAELCQDWRVPHQHQALSQLQVRFSLGPRLGFKARLPTFAANHLRHTSAVRGRSSSARDAVGGGKGRSPSACAREDAQATCDDAPQPAEFELDARVLIVDRGERLERLFAVRCDNPRDNVFGKAGALATQVLCVGGDALEEVDTDDRELADALQYEDGPWVDEPYLLIAATAGPFAGLRAVGVGSNLRKRRRAAQVALAATAAHASRAADAADCAVGGAESSRLAELARAADEAAAAKGCLPASVWL